MPFETIFDLGPSSIVAIQKLSGGILCSNLKVFMNSYVGEKCFNSIIILVKSEKVTI